MKTSRAGIVSAAILMVMAGLGFGIAQAGGDQLDNRASTLEKWITEYPNHEWQHRRRMTFNWHQETRNLFQRITGQALIGSTRGPVETGAIPGRSLRNL